VGYAFPVPLSPSHLVDDFQCRSEEQTRWLKRYARTSMAAGTANTFVVTQHRDRAVVAYYAWRMGELTWDQAPRRWQPGVGKYPQPVAVLARLGVDEAHEGLGLGAGLLSDVLIRFVAVSEEIGVRGLLIHCQDQSARAFYEHLIPELEPLDEANANRTTLVLLGKDLHRTLGSRPNSG